MARVVQLAIDVLAVTIHPRRRVCVCVEGRRGGWGRGIKGVLDIAARRGMG